jgi:hypothetical protein
LKEIQKARETRRKQVKAGLTEREALVEQFLVAHQEEQLVQPAASALQSTEPAQPRLKRYINE